MCRSRKGAWIEIDIAAANNPGGDVAPARERGLKLKVKLLLLFQVKSRSRKGAWIEMVIVKKKIMPTMSLPQGSVD